MNSVDDFRTNTPSAILFECIAGSGAYGTDVSSSDEDIRGIFAVPATAYLDLSRPHDQISDDRGNVVYYSSPTMSPPLSNAAGAFFSKPAGSVSERKPLGNPSRRPSGAFCRTLRFDFSNRDTPFLPIHTCIPIPASLHACFALSFNYCDRLVISYCDHAHPV